MKKLLVILSSGLILASCGGGEGSKEKNADEAKQETAPIAEEKGPEYKKGLELVASSDCFSCHKVKETAVGPAYEAIAARYENNDKVIDTLAGKIIKGGAGRWGTVPMTPHPQLSQEDAKTMVKYVMALKK